MKKLFPGSILFGKTAGIILISFTGSCNTASVKDINKPTEIPMETAPESRQYTVRLIKNYGDTLRGEIDTATGYAKYYKNGILTMEGKLSKNEMKRYRDGVWKYYNEKGQLVREEKYRNASKVNSLEFLYFPNNKPMSEIYQYFEGDYRIRSTFRFHKIEQQFYRNGQILSERHWINNNLVDSRYWDSTGHSRSR